MTNVPTVRKKKKTKQILRRKWTLVVEGRLLVGHLDHERAEMIEHEALRRSAAGAGGAAPPPRQRAHQPRNRAPPTPLAPSTTLTPHTPHHLPTFSTPQPSLTAATPLGRSIDKTNYRGLGEREGIDADPVRPVQFTHFFDQVNVSFQTFTPPPSRRLPTPSSNDTESPQSSSATPRRAAAAAASSNIALSASLSNNPMLQLQVRPSRDSSSAMTKGQVPFLPSSKITNLTWTRILPPGEHNTPPSVTASATVPADPNNPNEPRATTEDTYGFLFSYVDEQFQGKERWVMRDDTGIEGEEEPAEEQDEGNDDAIKVYATVQLQRRNGGGEARYIPSDSLAKALNFPKASLPQDVMESLQQMTNRKQQQQQQQQQQQAQQKSKGSLKKKATASAMDSDDSDSDDSKDGDNDDDLDDDDNDISKRAKVTAPRKNVLRIQMSKPASAKKTHPPKLESEIYVTPTFTMLEVVIAIFEYARERDLLVEEVGEDEEEENEAEEEDAKEKSDDDDEEDDDNDDGREKRSHKKSKHKQSHEAGVVVPPSLLGTPTIRNDAVLTGLFGCTQMSMATVRQRLVSRKLLLPAGQKWATSNTQPQQQQPQTPAKSTPASRKKKASKKRKKKRKDDSDDSDDGDDSDDNDDDEENNKGKNKGTSGPNDEPIVVTYVMTPQTAMPTTPKKAEAKTPKKAATATMDWKPTPASAPTAGAAVAPAPVNNNPSSATPAAKRRRGLLAELETASTFKTATSRRDDADKDDGNGGENVGGGDRDGGNNDDDEEDTEPLMLSCDVDVEVPALYHERTREILRRIKRREFEYTSSRTRAVKHLTQALEDGTAVKSLIQDVVSGRGYTVQHIPVHLALASAAPEGSEAREASQIDARLSMLLDRLDHHANRAKACWEIVDALRRGAPPSLAAP